MSQCEPITACRACGEGSGGLLPVLDLGQQALAGQFPAAGEPDPPRFPVRVVRCIGCGLNQLAHTVDPELMFRAYHYRCLGGGQRLFALLDGKLVHEPVRVLFRTGKPISLPCVAKDGSVSWRPVAYHQSGEKVVYTIYFSDGSRVVASEDHKWQMIARGVEGSSLRWKKDGPGNRPGRGEVQLTTRELKVGDRVPRVWEMPRPASGVDDGAIYGRSAGYLVGAWFAEGSDDANPHAVKLTVHESKDDAMLARIREYVTGDLHENFHEGKKHKVNKSKTAYISGPVMHAILRKFVRRDGKKNKVFTNEVWAMPRPFLEGLIEGWLDGDGCKYDDGHWQVNFVARRHVVEDLALMCNLLGYAFRYILRRGTGAREERKKNYITAVIRKDRSRSRQRGKLGNLGVVSVRRIERVPSKHDTWDVHVGGDELFSLGNGVVTHNSAVTQTMRSHLRQLAEEACAMLASREGEVCAAPRILDIGGNDGTLLDAIPCPTGNRVVIDPSDVDTDPAYPGIVRIKGFFPTDLLLDRKFDLVFSIACFYDANRPKEWAAAVKRILAPDGLWVIEVADLKAVLDNAAFDFWAHEHTALYSLHPLISCLRKSGLKAVRAAKNPCNGGSIRVYVTHLQSEAHDGDAARKHSVGGLWSEGRQLASDTAAHDTFARRSQQAIGQLRGFLGECKAAGKRVHILGASTKGNVVWQAAGLTPDLVPAASDRDPRKAGRRLPGTNIPIVSEEQSRAAKPDIYLSALAHFREELAGRERAFLEAGGKIAFPLPYLQTFSFAGPDNPSPLPGWEDGRRV